MVCVCEQSPPFLALELIGKYLTNRYQDSNEQKIEPNTDVTKRCPATEKWTSMDLPTKKSEKQNKNAEKRSRG